jgi:hypothetical protein
MMRNCIHRPEPGQHAITPSCRHSGGQAGPSAADDRPSAPGTRPPWQTACEPYRETTRPARLAAMGGTRIAVMLVNGRAGAVKGLPSPEAAPITAPVPVPPSIHGPGRA